MRSLFILLTLVLLVSCKAQQNSINNVEWKLVKMGDTNISGLSQPVTITLDETTNKISGYGGCNRYFGTYQTNGAISFSGIGSTKMYCQDTMPIESAYFEALAKVQSYKTEGNKLYVLAENKVVLEFSR